MKAATYNIAGGAGYSGYKVTTDYSLIAKDILDSGADIVGMQEVDCNTHRNLEQDTVAKIMEYTGFNGYFAPAINCDCGTYGNALISRYPIISAETIPLPFTRDKEEHRCLLHAVLKTDGGKLDVFVSHTDQGSIREQITAVRDTIKKYSCKNFILLGDFNYTDKPENSAFDILSDCKKANPHENKIGTTLDGYAFDNIIVPAELDICNIHTVNTGHSDHMMLIADITGL